MLILCIMFSEIYWYLSDQFVKKTDDTECISLIFINVLYYRRAAHPLFVYCPSVCHANGFKLITINLLCAVTKTWSSLTDIS